MKINYTNITILIIIALIVYFLVFRAPKIVRKAKSYLGQIEISSGTVEKGFRNPFFENLLRAHGWQQGADWCATFVRAVVLDSVDAEKRNVLQKLLTPSTQTNYNNLADAAKKYNWIQATTRPVVGSIVTWQNTANPAKGHTGIVTKVIGKYFQTIEGNIDVGGIDGVGTRWHSLDELQKTSGLRLLPVFFKIT